MSDNTLFIVQGHCTFVVSLHREFFVAAVFENRILLYCIVLIIFNNFFYMLKSSVKIADIWEINFSDS